ncbi:hypothetical protein CEXT_750581 [Caerostris extrusa]|uniref:Uncharacterized protein n=1 Tax=Caerostris extrusa TaxID=172846 RepID=A0AAV4TP46_CAEEX|nr:hypothetical protein CEXT_750581 [Caerostris extrusa]
MQFCSETQLLGIGVQAINQSSDIDSQYNDIRINEPPIKAPLQPLPSPVSNRADRTTSFHPAARNKEFFSMEVNANSVSVCINAPVGGNKLNLSLCPERIDFSSENSNLSEAYLHNKWELDFYARINCPPKVKESGGVPGMEKRSEVFLNGGWGKRRLREIIWWCKGLSSVPTLAMRRREILATESFSEHSVRNLEMSHGVLREVVGGEGGVSVKSFGGARGYPVSRLSL